MTDLTTLLDGPAADVKTRLSDLSHDDLLKLKGAEEAGSNRAEVLSDIDTTLAALDAKRAGGVVQMQAPVGVLAVAAALDTSGPADIAAATEFSPSGAPRQVTEIDAGHPAIDNDPRANTTLNMNRIDLNHPTKPGHEVVEEALGMKTEAGTDKAKA